MELELKPFTTSLSTIQKGTAAQSCAICPGAARYKCPGCGTRTCSAACSKAHKEEQQCNGQRPTKQAQQTQWRPIVGQNQFKPDQTGIEDQQFLHSIGQNVHNKLGKDETIGEKEYDGNSSGRDEDEISASISLDSQHSQNPLQLQKSPVKQLSQIERSLVQSAQFRRVWLRVDQRKAAPNSSHHEPFSDTIFWECTVKFVCRPAQTGNPKVEEEEKPTSKQLSLVDYEDDEEGEGEEKAVEEMREIVDEEEGMAEEALIWTSYTVQNIAESIRVSTLLRQFLRPKPHGTVISRSQLDMAKIEPFISASSALFQDAPKNGGTGQQLAAANEDNLHVYLQVELPIGGGEADEDGEETAEMRYYPVDPERTILENLRNRHVIGHPCFVVVLRRASEFGELELPMVSEADGKLLQAERDRLLGGNSGFKDRPKWQQHHQNRGGHGRGGGGRGGRGGRGGGNRRGRGGQQPKSHGPIMYAQPQPQPPHPHFFHPYVAAGYQHPQLQYHQGQHVGQPQPAADGNWQWPQQQRQWTPQQNVWRGANRGGGSGGSRRGRY